MFSQRDSRAARPRRAQGVPDAGENPETAPLVAPVEPEAVRVAVEAGVRMGWDKYIRNHGDFVGMTGFGASAPAPDLYRHFGITAEVLQGRFDLITSSI